MAAAAAERIEEADGACGKEDKADADTTGNDADTWGKGMLDDARVAYGAVSHNDTPLSRVSNERGAAASFFTISQVDAH